MLRILITLYFAIGFSLTPATANEDTTPLPPTAEKIWQGWKTLSSRSRIEIEATMENPERIKELFGTASEGLIQLGIDIQSGEIETRNPFTAIGGYFEYAAQCKVVKDWLEQEQDNILLLWQFLQDDPKRMTKNVRDVAGTMVAMAEQPHFKPLQDYFAPEKFGFYLEGKQPWPVCGGPRSTSMVQVLAENPAIVGTAQGDIVQALTASALTGDAEAAELLGWLAGIFLASGR